MENSNTKDIKTEKIELLSGFLKSKQEQLITNEDKKEESK